MLPNCEKTISTLNDLNQRYHKSKLEALKLLKILVKAILAEFKNEEFCTIFSPTDFYYRKSRS